MHIKSILAAAVIALAASVGSASAADQFTTLDGVQALPMNTAEMDQVRGAAAGILLTVPGPKGGDLGPIEAAVHVATDHAPLRSVPVGP